MTRALSLPSRWLRERALRPTRRAGFTLIELLVAISILAILAVISWRGLDSLTTTRARLQPEADDIRALLVSFGQLERDLEQVASPTLFALKSSPVRVRQSDVGQFIEIVRIAPGSDTEATAVQTITYRVAEQTLVRQATPASTVYAAVPAERIATARLLDKVKSIRLRLWKTGEGWSVPVDPSGAAAPGAAVVVPPGVEIEIERVDGRVYRRVLLVG